jgi:two-component system sensor histidine kinase/response regulator
MKQGKEGQMSVRKKMILMALGLGALYWVVGSTLDAFIFQEGKVIEEIFTLEAHKVWMRSLVLCTLIMFSIYALSIISQRKKAEQALREREEKHRSLVEQSLQALVLIQDQRVVFANASTAEITGYTVEELFSLSPEQVKQVIHPDDREFAWKRLINRLDGKPVNPRHEFRTIRKDGSIRWIEVSSTCIQYQGKIALQVAFIDITERKKAEEQTLLANERLHFLLSSTSAVIYTASASGDYRTTFISDNVKQMVGYEPHEFIENSKFWEDHVHTEDRERVLTDLSLPSEGKRYSYEYRFRRKDGTYIWVRDDMRIVHDEKGQPREIIGFWVDITERKRAEQKLKSSEEKYRTLVKTSPDAVTVTDLEGYITYVSQRTLELHGYQRPEELLGTNCFELIAPEDRIKAGHNLEKTLKDEIIRDLEYVFLRKDGTRFFAELNAALIRDSDGKPSAFIATIKDITERKRDEEVLKKAKEQAEEANRLKSEFLANMSHEIRTPMNAIIGMTDITLNTDLSDEQRDYLTTVKLSARSLLELLNDILDLSKIEADKIALETIDFDLRVTVEGVADTLARKASEKKLELACMIHHLVPSLLRGDPGRLRQILMNLLGNAIKFTEQGEIVIAVELEEETEEKATLVISVTDTGMGIPLEKQNKIFDSFTQVDGSISRKYGGTGLGLSICNRLVGLMGGQIGVESEPGKGSRFWCKVTLEKQQETDDDLGMVPPDIRGMRMLVVDDNSTNRMILVKMLESFGCSPVTATTGTEAIQRLKREVHQEKLFDLVLLDMQMPKMDGVETLKAIKADPEIRDVIIIMLTSLGVRGDVSRLETLGCAGYLLKPVKQSQLFDSIITVLARRTKVASYNTARIVTRHTLAEQKRRRIRVLLAEDNPMNQKLAVTLLKKAGYSVEAVENGKLAVEALNRKPYDLILMDVQMPEMDGFETTQAIRERKDDRKSTPIVAMTAHAMKGDRERCLAAGMDDYVSKPIEPQELLEVVKKWVVSIDQEETTSERDQSKKEPRRDNPVVEIDKVLSDRFGGDTEFFAGILREFLGYAPRQLENLARAIEESDHKMVENEAHSLKGAVGNLGAKRLAELSYDLERTGRKGDLSNAAELLENLRIELKRMEEYVNNWQRTSISLQS